MKLPETPIGESERLAALGAYSILDTLPEPEYDAITRIASEICHTSISLISLIDEKRQWFKSRKGLDATETHRNFAFCAHAINEPEKMLEVSDSRVDNRFADNPLVTGAPHVIFYAGIPLVSPEGQAIGTLCVIDHQPKKLNENQVGALKALSRQVMALLELRKHKSILEHNRKELKERNQSLDAFAKIVAHDIKSPLVNIAGLLQMIIKKHATQLDAKAMSMVSMMESASGKVIGLVDGILNYSTKKDGVLSVMGIDLQRFLKETVELIAPHVEVIYPPAHALIFADKVALQQIFINLITNAVKYNDKAHIRLKIGFKETACLYEFCVEDNGMGIAQEDLDRIFKIYEVVSTADRNGNRGHGIGLSTVKTLVEDLGGQITVSSVPKVGSKFAFSIAKKEAV